MAAPLDAYKCDFEPHQFGDVTDHEGRPVCSRCGFVEEDFDDHPVCPHCGGEAGHRCRGVPLPADEVEALYRDVGEAGA